MKRRKRIESATAESAALRYRKRIAERERAGDRLSATPERMAKSDEPFTVIGDDKAQIFVDAPLEKLFRAGGLAGRERDERLAIARHDAGRLFYGYWYFGELVPLGSRDYRKPYSGASQRFALLSAAERREHARRKWRQADAMFRAYGPGGRSYDRVGLTTHAVMIEEKPLAEVGMLMTGRRHEAQARAVTIEMLIDGVDRLIGLWTGKD